VRQPKPPHYGWLAGSLLLNWLKIVTCRQSFSQVKNGNIEIVVKLQAQAVNLDDRELGILLDPYRMKSGILMAFFDDAEEFYVHSSDPLLAKLAKRSAAHRDSRNGRNAVRDHITTHGYGCLVQNSNGTKWGVRSPKCKQYPTHLLL
jgi:hypothetical protein